MSEKTLSEIIEAVRDGEKPDYDDLRYAICAMEALRTFDRMALRTLVEAEWENKKPILVYSAEFQYKKLVELDKKAMDKPPKEFIGWNNDPENPEFLERRNTSKNIVNKLIEKRNGQTAKK